MLLLLLVSFVWAFSFGLIKEKLTGLDSTAIAVVRIALSAAVFLPFLRPRGLAVKTAVALTMVGAIQFGLMYVLYLRAYAFLQAFEVALFTIFTPLYLTLMEAFVARRFEQRHLWAALLSVAGAGIVLWHSLSTSSLLTGFLLIQASNVCFALGQFAYRRIRIGLTGKKDSEIFGFLYLGAVLLTGGVSLGTTSWTHFHPTLSQWQTLLYLGVLASGLCFFWWNVGATRVNAGTLAAFNNAKVPLGVACSLIFFGEKADVPRLLSGLILLSAAIWIAQRAKRAKST